MTACNCCNKEIIPPNRIESQYSYMFCGNVKIYYECADCGQVRRNKELQEQLEGIEAKAKLAELLKVKT